MVLRSYWLSALAACILGIVPATAQVIEFESNGLKYQTLTKSGLTIMYAQMPSQVHDYAILQVAVSNGSKSPWTIRPEDFVYHRRDGDEIRGASAGYVVGSLISKAGRNDVIRLVSTYESGLYGLSQFKSTNGYEQRRQAALAEVSSAKLKAAAAASAIALVLTKLAPGESTDGAVFLPVEHKNSLGEGHLVVKAGGETFEFRH
jgi:hypothetical protein